MKKILLLILIFLLSLTLCPAARAVVYIDDQAELLSDAEHTQLENMAKEIVDKHSFDLLIVSSNDLGGLSPEEYSDDIYKETEFGKGIDRDGLIVTFSFGENKGYCFYPTGIGNKIFTAEVAEKIFDTAYTHFVNTEDFEFYSSLLSQIDATLETYEPPSRVLDDADVLSGEQEKLLKERINFINQTYNFDVVLVTAKDITSEYLPAYSADIYTDGLYGFGEKSDGVLFAVSSPSNENYIHSSGYGSEVFTDYGTTTINSHLTFALSSGDCYTAFSLFLDDTELFLKEAFQNVPFDESNPARLTSPWALHPAVIIIILITAMVCAYTILDNLRKKTQDASK